MRTRTYQEIANVVLGHPASPLFALTVTEVRRLGLSGLYVQHELAVPIELFGRPCIIIDLPPRTRMVKP